MRNRVLYFRKWADFLLSHIQLVLVLIFTAAFLAAFFLIGQDVATYIMSQTNAASDELNDLLKNILSAVVAAIVASLLTFAVRKLLAKRKRSLESKRRLYSLCEGVFENTQSIWVKRFVLCVIQLFYGHQRRIIASQGEATKKLVSYVSKAQENRKKIIWIAGPPFSGKTTVVLDFIMQLAIRDDCRTLFQRLDRKIHYYDVAHDRDQLTQVLKKLRFDFYRSKLLIVDNAYKVSPEAFLEFINETKIENTFATIVLTRRPQDFLSQDGQIEALASAMKTAAHQINLGELPVQDALKRGVANDIDRRYGIGWKTDNEKVIFHLANLVYLNEAENLLSSFALFLKGDLGNRDLRIFFASVAASCLFTGSVSFETLRMTCPGYQVEKSCRLLAKTGFLGMSPDEGHKRCMLHESLSQYYVRRTYETYRKEYQNVFRALLNCTIDISASYLYSRLLAASAENRSYDALFLSINYRTLLVGLSFVSELEPRSKETYSREFGILYDRIGELSNALSSYRQYYADSHSADALLKELQVDHTIYGDCREAIERFSQGKDAYASLLARYWQLHMEMHTGIFSFDSFSALMQVWDDHVSEIIAKEPYSGLHLLRRCYFDYFRTYYLCGVLDPTKLQILERRLLERGLSELNEFHAYYEKFVYGHYLHYDVLFEMGALGKTPSRTHWSIVMGDQQTKTAFENSGPDKSAVMNLALEHYEKAYGYMERVGDKTAYFVRCRQMEIKVAQGSYDEAERFYRLFQEFAEREHSDYYLGCAALYTAKLNLAKRLDPNLDENADPCEQEEAVRQNLDTAQDHFKKADPVNYYIDAHIALYRLLTDLISSGSVSEKGAREKIGKDLASLKEDCVKYGYRREVLLIEKMMAQDSILSFFYLGNIVKFYPFVAQ